MSININQNGLPDTAELEKLANEFFSVLPGQFPNSNVLEQVKKPQTFNTNDPPTSLADPSFEKGYSAQATPATGSIPPTPPQSNLSYRDVYQLDHTSKGVENASQFLPGRGATPAVIQEGNVFNQANLPFLNNGTPAEQLKTFITPNSSVLQKTSYVNVQEIPYALDQPFDTELSSVFKSINPTAHTPQLPGVDFNQNAYYFVQEKISLEPGKSPNPFSKKIIDNPNAGINAAPFDVNLIKKDFPILQEQVNGRQLIWLDNAATTQKPKQVIDRISYFYEHENSNIHRAAHELAARATDAYEAARKKVQTFLNAASPDEIVFVRGTTEAINLVAKSWGEQYLNAGDEIIISHLEHHANIVPWQQLAAKKNLRLRVIPVDDDGQVLLDEYAKLLNPKTKLVSFTQVSNALGTITPAKQIVEMAHAAGAKVLVDGAQSVSHLRTNVVALNADWFVFSGHKVFGPTGIGVLYGKLELLNETQPWQGGGNMIKDVTFEHTEYHNAPGRFEAGTGNIADAVGLGAAIDYVNKIGIDAIHQYEHQLLLYATKLLKDVPGLRLIGTAPDKASVLSFVFDGYRTEEVGEALNRQGIAVRSGHHCAQPILRRFGLESTVRPSLAFYNTCSDIHVLVETLYKLRSGHKQTLR